MSKHIFSLTYKPKIPYVQSGKCTQTIRPRSIKKPAKPGDWIMFFGWSGEPFKSKWSFRTPYMQIIQTLDITFEKYKELIVIRTTSSAGDLHTISKGATNKLAILDGFDNFREMIRLFLKMYGNALLIQTFTVIRWNPNLVLKEPESEEDDSQQSLDDLIKI